MADALTELFGWVLLSHHVHCVMVHAVAIPFAAIAHAFFASAAVTTSPGPTGSIANDDPSSGRLLQIQGEYIFQSLSDFQQDHS